MPNINQDGTMLEFIDMPLPRCPRCGGMLLLVSVPPHGEVVWCSECEEIFEPMEVLDEED